ncbi:MAG: hypothetical protein ACYTHJ_06405 [Planctomycetota bacterium]
MNIETSNGVVIGPCDSYIIGGCDSSSEVAQEAATDQSTVASGCDG